MKEKIKNILGNTLCVILCLFGAYLIYLNLHKLYEVAAQSFFNLLFS